MAKIIDNGKNNRIEVAEEVGGTIQVKGDNNEVFIGKPFGGGSIYIELGSRNKVFIDADCVLGNLFVHAHEDAALKIGANTSFNGLVRVLMHEGKRVTIGKDCLFGASTDLTVSDMHSVVSIQTGKRINPPRDITLGDHVWVGQGCMVLKGTTIGDGSVIGAGSVVSGPIPEYTVAAGNPARVIREGASWQHQLLPFDTGTT